MSSRALLISADAHTAGVLGEVLAEMEIVVEECGDFSAARRKLTTGQYEVILVDSPDQPTGDRLLQQARSSQANQSSLVISVVDAGSSVRSVFAMGANFILYRPVSAERARASLRAASRLVRRENRKHRRAPVCAQASLSYSNVESMPAILVDLSEEGLALQCQYQLPSQSKVYFRFTLPGQTKCVQMSGETVWQDSTGRAGVRFLDVPQVARRLLKEWLNSRISVEQSKVTVQLPVGQPGRLASSPSDRRIQSRHACQLGAAVYRAGVNVPHRCHLTDISVGGCYVETPSPFPTGTNLEIVVRTSEIKFRSEGVVQVVHPGFGMGVAFGTHTDQQRQQVQQLIKLVFKNREADADPILRF
ncbi:MAG TPA: PilZ domain-containing protein [Terriglobales bacterium]|nr:PilZ domain-containing protein [Terriglobales bacterium]